VNKLEPDLNTDQVVGHYKKHMDRQYIGSHDLMKPDGTYSSVTVEVDAVYKRTIFNPGKNTKENRLVASLKGKDKDFILNATNCKSMEQISGSPMSNNWPGTKIKLVVKNVKVGRDSVDALRIERAE
jgi:hypothetical protein